MRKTELLQKAAAAGYTVTTEPSGYAKIVRRHRRTGKIIAGVVIWPDGTAQLADMDLAAAKYIRGNVNIAKILGL